MSTSLDEKYPNASRYLKKTGLTLDQALIFTELQLKQKGGEAK